MYSNFKGKDDLFLAVLDAEARLPTLPKATLAGVTTPLPEMVAALNAFQPEALTAYPSMAAALAEEQLQGRLRVSPALAATTSEVPTADMRRRMARPGGWTRSTSRGHRGARRSRPRSRPPPVPRIDRDPGHGAKLKLVVGEAGRG